MVYGRNNNMGMIVCKLDENLNIVQRGVAWNV